MGKHRRKGRGFMGRTMEGRMTKLVCVGCRLEEYQGSFQYALPSLKSGDNTLYFVCPSCDQNPHTSLKETSNGDKELLTHHTYILGRGFANFSLGMCSECQVLFTFDSSDHGLRDYGVIPGRTYVIQCPGCCGKGKFKVFGEAYMVDEQRTNGTVFYSYKYKRKLDITLEVRDHVERGPVHRKDVMDYAKGANRDDKTKAVYAQILKGLVTYQPDGLVLGTDRHLAAKTISMTPKTAHKYLTLMVQDGILQELIDEATSKVFYILIREEN